MGTGAAKFYRQGCTDFRGKNWKWQKNKEIRSFSIIIHGS